MREGTARVREDDWSAATERKTERVRVRRPIKEKLQVDLQLPAPSVHKTRAEEGERTSENTY